MSNKALKEETIEEFKARGGQIKIYPYNKPEDEEAVIYPKSQISQDFMDLGDGEFFFSEVKTPLARSKSTGALIDSLPKDIQNLLIKEFL